LIWSGNVGRTFGKAGYELLEKNREKYETIARPVQIRIDEPMVDKAISIGERIGVAATAPTTLKPTTEMVTARAKVIGKDVKVDSVLCKGAYDAMFSGDQETHDNIVRDSLRQLMKHNDVILLAQASMARVIDTIPADERIVPILSSPQLAVERARDVIASVSE